MLSLVGGILILFNEMIMMIGGSLFIEFIGMGIMVIGTFLGLIVIVGSIVLYSRPALHGAMGVTIMLVSLASIIIGTIMGSIYGILASVWGSQRGGFPPGRSLKSYGDGSWWMPFTDALPHRFRRWSGVASLIDNG